MVLEPLRDAAEMLTVVLGACEPSASVTERPVPEAVSPELQVSDAAPPTGQKGSPAIGELPLRDIVPLNAEPVLLVTVRNPESGLAQIVPLVLHTALVTVPVAACPLLTPTLVTVNDVPGTTELMTNVPLFAVSAHRGRSKPIRRDSDGAA